MSSIRWSWAATGMTILAALVVMVGVAGEREKGLPARASGEVNRDPEGPDFPVAWKYSFGTLSGLAVGKEIEVSITVSATLFDMKEVEITPATNEDLELVAGPVWKGALKKGEAHVVKFTVRPTKVGFNGVYGVMVRAPRIYDEMTAYITAQQEGAYATAKAKAFVLEEIEGMRAETPVRQEWFGSSITVPEKGGK